MSGTSCIIVGFSFATNSGCELLNKVTYLAIQQYNRDSTLDLVVDNLGGGGPYLWRIL